MDSQATYDPDNEEQFWNGWFLAPFYFPRDISLPHGYILNPSLFVFFRHLLNERWLTYRITLRFRIE